MRCHLVGIISVIDGYVTVLFPIIPQKDVEWRKLKSYDYTIDWIGSFYNLLFKMSAEERKNSFENRTHSPLIKATKFIFSQIL